MAEEVALVVRCALLSRFLLLVVQVAFIVFPLKFVRAPKCSYWRKFAPRLFSMNTSSTTTLRLPLKIRATRRAVYSK